MIDDLDINAILTSSKVFSDLKMVAHIGYKDDDCRITPVCIMLQKMSWFGKSFNVTK